MFKRRLAVLGAVAVLAITGLAGSAMADEPPATAGAKVTCTTSDGKTIELAKPLRAKGGVVITRDGKVHRVKPGTKVSLRDGEAPEAVKLDALEDGEAPEAVKIEGIPDGERLRAVPARPALPEGASTEVAPVEKAPGEKGVAKRVKIICKKPAITR
ncbi:hypothetical protein ACFLIM_35415 [Nonomuraea sp. M3C6]|uniref:Uncharacterized protein n=1 Tax=Nonomuraea marmarensis TaxID=3351344 RepID=A0ABW7AQJ1_9ACTN